MLLLMGNKHFHVLLDIQAQHCSVVQAYYHILRQQKIITLLKTGFSWIKKAVLI